MEEARKLLFEKAMKKFTMQELVKHAHIGSGQHNLIELISRYPGAGQGFKVYKRTWPDNSFYYVKNVHLFVNTPFLCLLVHIEWSLRSTHGYQVLARKYGQTKVRTNPRCVEARLLAI